MQTINSEVNVDRQKMMEKQFSKKNMIRLVRQEVIDVVVEEHSDKIEHAYKVFMDNGDEIISDIFKKKYGSSGIVDRNLLKLLDAEGHGAEKLFRHVMHCLVPHALSDKKNYTPLRVLAQQVGLDFMFKDKDLEVSRSNRTKLGVLLIHMFNRVGVYILDEVKAENAHDMNVVRIAPSVLKLIDRDLKDDYKLAFKKPPMLAKPAEWAPGKRGGYLTDKSLSLIGGSYLNEQVDVGKTAYECLNRLQSTSFVIDKHIAAKYMDKFEDKFYHENENIEDISMRQRLAHAEVRRFHNTVSFMEDKPFHFAYNFDFRSRVYADGHYLHRQGGTMKNALLEFADKEALSAEGESWLLESFLATFKGGDKLKFGSRAPAFGNGVGTSDKEVVMNEKFGHYLEMAGRGEEIGAICHFDAVNSALQFYAVLLRSRALAELCGLVDMPGDQLPDAYGTLAKLLNEEMSITSVTRDDVKSPFMVFLYGSGKRTIVEKLQSCGIGTTMSDDKLYKLFMNAMNKLVPDAIKAMNYLYMIVDAFPKKDTFSWTTPSGFPVHFKGIGTKRSWVNTSLGKYEIDYECVDSMFFKSDNMHSAVKEGNSKARGLLPNMIHSIDGHVVHRMVTEHDFAIDVVHDSFGCHPNYAGKMLGGYVSIMRDLCRSNVLNDMVLEMTDGEFNAKRIMVNTLDPEDIVGGLY